MITNFLLEHHWFSPLVLAVVVVLGPVVARLVRDRPRAPWTLTALASVPVAVLTLVPTDRRIDTVTCAVQWSIPTVGRVELFANVVLFVAPVLFAGVALHRPLLAFAAGSLVSVVIEALQAVVPAVGRSCDTNDWLCNTIGAALGAVLAWLALRRTG